MIIVLVCCLGVVVLSLLVLVLTVLRVSRRIPPLVAALETAQERAEQLKNVALGLPRRHQD
ncbi:MAG: hypothetical protein ACJ73S_00970 [Mycobacteriales bacterium]